MSHGPDLYYEEAINPLFKAVMTGCKETLKRHKMVWCPNDTATPEYRAPKEIVTRGLNLGEAAAGALAKWAEREQEADILMLRWEASLAEQERSVELYPAMQMPTIPEGAELDDL